MVFGPLGATGAIRVPRPVILEEGVPGMGTSTGLSSSLNSLEVGLAEANSS